MLALPLSDEQVHHFLDLLRVALIKRVAANELQLSDKQMSLMLVLPQGKWGMLALPHSDERREMD